MAAVDGLKAKVRARGAQLHAEAVRTMEEALDAVVPDSGEPATDHVKLRDSRTVSVVVMGDVLSARVTYSSMLEGGEDLAELMEQGTHPHPIEPIGEGYPLRFYWPKVGAEVRAWHVDHPGSHVHDGWFANTVADWSDHLQRASGSV